MKSKSVKLVKNAIIGSLAFGLSPTLAVADEHADASAKSDTRLEATIETSILLNRHLNPFEIDSEVVDGKAVLNGTVDESVDKELAEEIAKSVDGVRSVENNIKVDERYEPKTRTARERSFATRISDATITASVKSQLLWSRRTSGLDINVDTSNSQVSLMGTVASSAEKELAEQIAENTEGVRDVKNKLVVNESLQSAKSGQPRANTSDGGIGSIDMGKVKDKAEEMSASVGRAVSDTWITSKVSSALLYNTSVSSRNIDVETTNAIVTLSGFVPSEVEKRRAEEVVSGLVGVKRVENDLQIAERS